MRASALARGTKVAAIALAAFAARAAAAYLDEDRALQVVGKLSTQASWRMDEPRGFTDPRIPVGNLIQSRHQLDLELYHDVRRWIDRRFSLRLPVSQLGYRLRIKPTYDGVTDYGPSKLDPDEHPGDSSLRQLDHEKILHDAFPWNAYVEGAFGPLFVRVGRQDLSWGETDAFRLLDQIQPLDNRFGFPLVEDLDDRRIPLWMVRGTVRLPFLNVAPFTGLVAEGYFVPGSIDDQESPVTPVASPFSINVPRPELLGATLRVVVPARELAHSRGGGRLMGSFLNRVTFALGHYRTWTDLPYGRIVVDASRGLDLSAPCDLQGNTLQQLACLSDNTLELHIRPIQISGASLSGAVPFDPLSILRAEFAYFHGEPIADRRDLSTDTLGRLAQQSAATGQPATTRIREADVARWMIGIDRNLWLRALNRTNTFFVSAQYFHTHVVDHDPNQVTGLIDPRGTDLDAFPFPELAFDPFHRDETVFTLGFNTFYWNGAIQPFPIFAYDVRGVWAIVPGVNLFLGSNWVVSLKFANVTGQWHNLGFFKDRDVLFAKLSYGL